MAKQGKVCPFRPLGDRVVIRPDEPEAVSRGGVVIPDGAKEQPTRGVVVATGPGRLLDSGERRPLQVAPGDAVLYGRYSGTDVEQDGVTYKVVSEGDVIAQLG
jgi:chaperonin GroES